MHQIFQNSLTLLSDSHYACATFCRIQILNLKTLGYLWFIPSYYLGFVDNYNEEKVNVTNKITPTTGIVYKLGVLKHFPPWEHVLPPGSYLGLRVFKHFWIKTV